MSQSRQRKMILRAGKWQWMALLGLSLGAAMWAAAHGKNPWPAPEAAKKIKNPVAANEASLAAGKALFFDHCAQCHGEGGQGDGEEAPMYDVKPADFTDAHMMGEMTDGEIFWKISEGRRPMPTFKKKLSEEQRWHLVNYVRTFAAKPAKGNSPKHEPAKGKPRSPKG